MKTSFQGAAQVPQRAEGHDLGARTPLCKDLPTDDQLGKPAIFEMTKLTADRHKSLETLEGVEINVT